MNKQAKSLIALGLLFLVSGCASAPLVVNTVPVDKPIINLPVPPSVDMRSLKWYIVTVDNVADVLANLKAQNVNPVLFALTDDGYQALSLNFAEIKAYIDNSNSVVIGYKDYYEKPNSTIPEN